MSDQPLVLGIETSCDETGVGIVRGETLLVDAIASSVDEHARFGGVVPEVASRALQHGLDGAMAGCLGPGQLVGVALAHEAEVFGQHGQLGTLVGGLRQQVSGGGEVGEHVSA